MYNSDEECDQTNCIKILLFFFGLFIVLVLCVCFVFFYKYLVFSFKNHGQDEIGDPMGVNLYFLLSTKLKSFLP